MQYEKKLLSLAKSNQTPFFVFSPETFEQNCIGFRKELKKIFPHSSAAYSVKTNPFPKALSIAVQNSFGLELASMDELLLAKEFSCLKIFNSPCKTALELKEALRQNALVMVDSFSELHELSGLAPKSSEIGLRLNYNSKKFGFSLDELKDAAEKAESLSLRVEALHCHPGTRQSLEKYSDFLSFVSNALEELPSFSLLDLGAGFPGALELQQSGHTLQEYFSQIKETLGSKIERKELVLEPGRALVSNSFSLVSRVHRIKKLAGQRIAVIDAGINLLPKMSLNKFSFTPITESGKLREEFQLAGPLLFGNDVVGEISAAIQEGDFLLVENVGAYCPSMAWEVSYKKPQTITV